MVLLETERGGKGKKMFPANVSSIGADNNTISPLKSTAETNKVGAAISWALGSFFDIKKRIQSSLFLGSSRRRNTKVTTLPWRRGRGDWMVWAQGVPKLPICWRSLGDRRECPRPKTPFPPRCKQPWYRPHSTHVSLISKSAFNKTECAPKRVFRLKKKPRGA